MTEPELLPNGLPLFEKRVPGAPDRPPVPAGRKRRKAVCPLCKRELRGAKRNNQIAREIRRHIAGLTPLPCIPITTPGGTP